MQVAMLMVFLMEKKNFFGTRANIYHVLFTIISAVLYVQLCFMYVVINGCINRILFKQSTWGLL